MTYIFLYPTVSLAGTSTLVYRTQRMAALTKALRHSECPVLADRGLNGGDPRVPHDRRSGRRAVQPSGRPYRLLRVSNAFRRLTTLLPASTLAAAPPRPRGPPLPDSTRASLPPARNPWNDRGERLPHSTAGLLG